MRHSAKAAARALRRVIPGCPDDPITLVVRAELHDQSLHCLLPIDRIVAMRERLEPHERVEPDPADARLARLHLPLVRRRGETWVLKGQSPGHMPDPVLVRALRSAHVMLHYDDDGLPALTAAPDTPHRRRLVRLAFLAPDIQRGIVEGRQSAGLTLTQLLKGPTGFNQHIWKSLERKMRRWACQRGVLYVVTGSLYELAPVERISYDWEGDGTDDNGILVDVPTHFFKFVYDPHNVEAIAFILPNRRLKTGDLPLYLTSIDDIEARNRLVSP